MCQKPKYGRLLEQYLGYFSSAVRFIFTDSNVRKSSGKTPRMKDWVLFRWWLALAKRLCHLKDVKSTQFLQKVTWLITHSLCHGGPGSPTSLQGVRLSPTNDAILYNLYSTTDIEYLLKVSLAPTNNNTSSWAQHMPWLAIWIYKSPWIGCCASNNNASVGYVPLRYVL